MMIFIRFTSWCVWAVRSSNKDKPMNEQGNYCTQRTLAKQLEGIQSGRPTVYVRRHDADTTKWKIIWTLQTIALARTLHFCKLYDSKQVMCAPRWSTQTIFVCGVELAQNTCDVLFASEPEIVEQPNVHTVDRVRGLSVDLWSVSDRHTNKIIWTLYSVSARSSAREKFAKVACLNSLDGRRQVPVHGKSQQNIWDFSVVLLCAHEEIVCFFSLSIECLHCVIFRRWHIYCTPSIVPSL